MRVVPVLAMLAALVLTGGGYAYWNGERSKRIPPGIGVANGRIEVERVDVASKFAGRVAEINVREGDPVAKDQIVGRMDVTELQAQLVAARATVRRATEVIGKAEAEVAIRIAEHKLSEIELRRAVDLASRNAGPAAEVDRRRAQHLVDEAMVQAARAAVGDAKAAKEVAEAQVEQLKAVISDMTLRTPVAGRVEYRLARTGEVLPPGGRVATILDLSEVYMTIFLPTGEAGRVAHGSEARIVLDTASEYVIPATVSFVAAEAQFTPKAVETANEREKLMYRVKLSIDPGLLETYRPYVRAGLTGNAYVKTRAAAVWPASVADAKLPDVIRR